MSTKKKPQAKTEDKPKYRLKQKVYFTDYTNRVPRIMEGKVFSRDATTLMTSQQDPNPGKEYTNFCYSIETIKGFFDVWQYRVHPSFQSAAIEHGKTIFEAL